MSNGKYLAKYFKERGVEIYALIEMRKVRSIAGGAPGDVSGDLFNLFDPSIYHQFFGSVEKVLNSGVAFDCIIPGSEHGVDTAELLAHQYGLSGNNPATTAYRRNKFVMQEQLRLHKLDYAKSMLIDLECKKPFTGEDLRGFSFPVILKPVNAAGMEDVFLCNSLEELNEKIESLDAQKINSIWVRNNLFVVQEYLDGEEFALDFVVHNDAPTSVCSQNT